MKESGLENRERPAVEVSTITGDELFNRIYQGESLPQDKRFTDFKRGGAFKYLHLNELVGMYEKRDSLSYSIVEEGDKIVGMAELQNDPDLENNLWLKFVSVDPAYQGLGYSSKLIEEIFRVAKERGCSIQVSRFSDEGKQRLKRAIIAEAEKTAVPVIDEHKQLV